MEKSQTTPFYTTTRFHNFAQSTDYSIPDSPNPGYSGGPQFQNLTAPESPRSKTTPLYATTKFHNLAQTADPSMPHSPDTSPLETNSDSTEVIGNITGLLFTNGTSPTYKMTFQNESTVSATKPITVPKDVNFESSKSEISEATLSNMGTTVQNIPQTIESATSTSLTPSTTKGVSQSVTKAPSNLTDEERFIYSSGGLPDILVYCKSKNARLFQWKQDPEGVRRLFKIIRMVDKMVSEKGKSKGKFSPVLFFSGVFTPQCNI